MPSIDHYMTIHGVHEKMGVLKSSGGGSRVPCGPWSSKYDVISTGYQPSIGNASSLGGVSADAG